MLSDPIIAAVARAQMTVGDEAVIAWNLHKVHDSETHSEMGAMGGGGRARFWLALAPLPSPTLDHQHAASEHAQNDQPRWLNDRKVYLICSIYNSTHYFEHTYDKSHHGATWLNPSTRLVCTWHDRSVECATGLSALRRAWINLCQQKALCLCAQAHAHMLPTSVDGGDSSKKVRWQWPRSPHESPEVNAAITELRGNLKRAYPQGGTPEQLLLLLSAFLLEWHPDKASCTKVATAVTRWLVDVRKPIVQARDAS